MCAEARPRVLMLTSTLPRWAGDAESGFILDLARELNADFEIELIAPHAPGAARREMMQGLQVARFRYWWPRWQSVAYQGGMAWRVRENPLQGRNGVRSRPATSRHSRCGLRPCQSRYATPIG